MTVLAEGETAPEFTLRGLDPAPADPNDDGEFVEFRLSEVADGATTVLAFYPGDFSPVCTRQLCSMRDLHLRVLGDEYRVLAVSRDSLFTHESFAYEHDIRFPLLSDLEGEVCRAYDAVHETDVAGRGVEPGLPKRTLYVVDTDRTIRYAWQSDDPYVEPDLSDVTDSLFGLEA